MGILGGRLQTGIYVYRRLGNIFVKVVTLFMKTCSNAKWIQVIIGLNHCQLNHHFYTPPHNSGCVLRYHGCPCVCACVHPSICRTSVCLSIFFFSDDNLSKYQWIFTKLSVYIDIVEIWFGIVTGQISSIFDRVICLR